MLSFSCLYSTVLPLSSAVIYVMQNNILAGLIAYLLFDAPIPFSAPLSGGHWDAILREAKTQGVTAVTYDAILLLPADLRPPRPQLFHLASKAQTIEDDSEKLENALSHFASEVFLQLGLETLVVKGLSLARLYPDPLHRERGDNDLFTGPATAQICSFMERQGHAVDRKDPRHWTFFFDDVEFECHTYLLYHHDDPRWPTVPFENRPHLRRLHTSYEAFFLAKHAEHNAVFFHKPLRLRTLVDWTLLLRQPDFDIDLFRRAKAGSDVEVFADLMSLYCNQLFDVNLPLDHVALQHKHLDAEHFDCLYLKCPERHRFAVVRVARRSIKYLRYGRLYRAIYGQSMFRRFYLHNVAQALRNRFRHSVASDLQSSVASDLQSDAKYYKDF